MKEKSVAYILWACGLLGLCGLHRFYIGKVGTGLIWLFTFGVFGIGQLVDVFTLGDQVDQVNTKQKLGTLTDNAIANAIEKENEKNAKSSTGK